MILIDNKSLYRNSASNEISVILRRALDHYRRAVREHFRNSLHHFIRIVTHADDGVSAALRGVLHQQVERVLARLFAHVREERDVSAHDRLQRRADISKNASRTHNDPADQPQRSHHAIARKLIRRRHHAYIHSSVHVFLLAAYFRGHETKPAPNSCATDSARALPHWRDIA